VKARKERGAYLGYPTPVKPLHPTYAPLGK
jgi:hypothetical protein